jgi:M6 family metalloprotease-like protein
MPRRDGTVPSQVTSAFQGGILSPPARPLLGTSSVQTQTVWVVPVIIVDFTDQAISSQSTIAAWNHILFDTTGSTPHGSVYDYYQWVSRGRLKVTGRVVAIVHLSQNKNYYAWSSSGLSQLNTPHNDCGVVNEAVSLADPSVDFSQFDQDHDGYVDMLWVMHSGLGGEATVATDNLWSITSALDQWSNGTAYVTNDPVPGGGVQKMRINRFSILPELSQFHPGQLSEIGVFSHEFGHALGLPDLYDTANPKNFGPGYFSLMSTGAYGSDGQSPELPAHMGAWPMLFLGWCNTVQPAFDTTMTLPAIEEGGPVVDFWFQGQDSPEHYLIEHRRRVGFSVNLPADGMLLYHVDDGIIGAGLAQNRINAGVPMGLRVVEADGVGELTNGTSRGDASDMYPGALNRTRLDDATFPSLLTNSGAISNLALENIQENGGQLTFTAQVRARGWQPATSLPGAVGTPSTQTGPGPRVAANADGSTVLVSSEQLPGAHPQIRVRTRLASGVWQTAETVSHSPGSAVDPAVATNPRGGYVVVWSDNRDGVNQLWCRTNLNGAWSAETRLTTLAGSSRYPSIGVDGRGFVNIAWLYSEGGLPQVRWLRFWFLNPAATSIPVTGPADRPDVPGIAVDAGGAAYILWSERSVSPAKIWFCRATEDSGVGVRNRLTVNDGTIQQGLCAIVDPAGTLHTVWLVPNASQNELHYQRREPQSTRPSIADTVLERRGEPLQNLALALDPSSGLHLAFEVATAGTPQVIYRHAPAGIGWDAIGTEVTLTSSGIASRPALVAQAPTRVDVFYLAYPGGVPAWTQRHREPWLVAGPTAVADAPAPVRPRLVASPNPVHPGTTVRLVWAGAPIPDGSRVTLLDLGGRRMAETSLTRAGNVWVASLPASLTRDWPTGIYFARVDGQPGAARLVLLH